MYKKGWRDDSVFKRTGFSVRGPGFNSQQSHDSSQLSGSPRSETLPQTYMPMHNLKNKLEMYKNSSAIHDSQTLFFVAQPLHSLCALTLSDSQTSLQYKD